MLIYKEELPVDTLDVREVCLPFSSAEKAVLKIDMQYNRPCMWYQTDYEKISFEEEKGKKFMIIAIGTGHDWEDKLAKDQYIGTALLFGDSLVLHYFLVDMDFFEKENEVNAI